MRQTNYSKMSKKSDVAIYGAAQHGSSDCADLYYGIREATPAGDRADAERVVYADAGSGVAWFAAAERNAAPDRAGAVTPTGRDGSRAGFALQSD